MEVRNASMLASDGKALVVEMDRARTFGAIEGLEGPDVVVEAAVDAGADAAMTPLRLKDIIHGGRPAADTLTESAVA